MLLRELRDIVLIAERDWLAWDFWQTSSGILTSVPWAQGVSVIHVKSVDVSQLDM